MQFKFIQIKLTGLGQGKVQMTGYTICPIYHDSENGSFITQKACTHWGML